LGMHVLVREGTVEQDEVAILPAITATNQQRFSFATDDKTSVDIVENGSIDHSVRVAVAHGMPLTQALTLATLYAAQAHQLMDVGALAAGYQADLFLTSDLATLLPQAVMVGGAWRSFDEPITPNRFAENLMTVTLQASDLVLPLETGRAHVIDVKPGHIDTTHAILEVPRDARGQFVANAEFAKITVAERYHDLGNGVGIIRGLGLRHGAVGTTFSNDSHNMVIAGVTDDLMLRAAEELIAMGGGMVVVSDDGTVTSLPLDIGGVMSSASAETIVTQTKALHTCLAAISDVSFDIFQTLSFMALPVIPSLKITDQGLFDFEKWDFIDINAD
ncbi:MAG: adenine deaminase C-terminal domain-containing protein, partial [Weissella cibaria]